MVCSQTRSASPLRLSFRKAWGLQGIYFEDLFQGGHITERRDVKVVIIGEAGAGKTRYDASISSSSRAPNNAV